MPLPKSPMGCPMDALLRVLMGPWTTYIIYVLRTNGPTRFGELKRRVAGISAKVLTERLRMLEDVEIIKRDYVPTIPPQVTYSLAERGHALTEIIDKLDGIARTWRQEDDAKAADTRRSAGAAKTREVA
ncbi:MAG TPA: helix-turn-helix domain-containing protein [Alphaproteobacteria bacterium]|nr:helix-turn-helix domain-containing protein [Alphaproteobacteria bacterium]